MKKIIDRLAALIRVKTIVTLVVIAVWAVLVLSGRDVPQPVNIIVATVISFYFGTQFEQQGKGK